MYYSPFVAINKKRIPVSGKLYDHYSYEKERLREKGILVCSQNKKSSQTNPTLINVNNEGNKCLYILS